MATVSSARDLLSLLAQHRTVGGAPRSEHEWLVAHGRPHRYEVGDVITAKGAQAAHLTIFFTGHVVIRTDRGAGARKVFEWRGGDVGGIMPYSRGASPPADAIAEEPTEALELDRALLPDMIRECPQVTALLVHVMVDRARQFKMSDLRDEKLVSLGKLASGLAHELNNPASAVMRSAKLLTASIDESESALRRLDAALLSREQLAAVEEVRALCTEAHATAMATGEYMTPLARADREEAIGGWLVRHGADPTCAAALAETSVTLAALERLGASVHGDALDAALRWLAAGCQVRALSAEIETAASRINELVASVKGFSYMDHAPAPEPVDIRKGIADTLTMLAAKVRAKSVAMAVDLPEGLPLAHGVGAELNQVWMNLLDNAVDAVSNGGHVTISARRERECLVVRILDDGPGIPAEIRERIFEPFFTTKGVGKGTGLGLDIVRRLVQQHEGEIALESAPGRTEFQVRLPIEG